MFEREAGEYIVEHHCKNCWMKDADGDSKCTGLDFCSRNKDWQKGAEFGYNKAKEEARLLLKDEGIVKPLKDSILRNERLSSQEQQELCAWIECAMDFGENLDECAKELEEAKKANEWHYVKDGYYPKDNKPVLCILGDIDSDNCEVGYYNDVESGEPWHFETYHLPDDDGDNAWGVSAWKEIVPPKGVKEK